METQTRPLTDQAFKPALDVVAGDGAVVVELALPGIDREDVTIERTSDGLAIRGICRDHHTATGDRFHAEIPRGPFFRTIPVPFAITGELRSSLDRGVLRIYLTQPSSEPKQARERGDEK